MKMNLVVFEEREWQAVLHKALKPEVKVIAAGINKNDVQLVYEDTYRSLPKSPVGKLSVILYNRFQQFKGDQTKGVELNTPFLVNAYVKQLEAFIIELAHHNNCDPGFIDWIENNTYFTNYF